MCTKSMEAINICEAEERPANAEALIYAKRMRNAYIRSHCVSWHAMWLYLCGQRGGGPKFMWKFMWKAPKTNRKHVFGEANVAQNAPTSVQRIRWHRNDTQFADHFELRIRFRFHAKLSQLLASLRVFNVQCSCSYWQLGDTTSNRRWYQASLMPFPKTNLITFSIFLSFSLSRFAGTWNTILPSTRTPHSSANPDAYLKFARVNNRRSTRSLYTRYYIKKRAKSNAKSVRLMGHAFPNNRKA